METTSSRCSTKPTSRARFRTAGWNFTVAGIKLVGARLCWFHRALFRVLCTSGNQLPKPPPCRRKLVRELTAPNDGHLTPPGREKPSSTELTSYQYLETNCLNVNIPSCTSISALEVLRYLVLKHSHVATITTNNVFVSAKPSFPFLFSGTRACTGRQRSHLSRENQRRNNLNKGNPTDVKCESSPWALATAES